MASFEGVASQLELSVSVGSGEGLGVRQFTVHERMSSLFVVSLVAVSENPSVDFDGTVGEPARFAIRTGPWERAWSGVCSHLQQVAVEERGLSTYHLTLVPTLWFATQRRNHRMFQQRSELDIVLELLSEWSVEPELRLSGKYKKRKYRVQYAESDFAFMSRMLEDAGISYHFEQHGEQSKLVLSDAPEARAPRATKLPFRDHPMAGSGDYVTAVHIGKQVRPGRYTMRDHDYRLPPDYKLLASAGEDGGGVEQRLEQFHYTPGAFLFGTEKGDDTRHADDRGKTRTDEAEAGTLAQKRLAAERESAVVCTFETSAIDVEPGVVIGILDHPHARLGENERFLIVETTLSGTVNTVKLACEARSAASPYRPPLLTPKPRVTGVESATVVGPKGEEIHTDEFGRVRVHFHWDRESKMDERSSCWIHVSQPWGGAGYGASNLPRIGQEVLVDFLGGDPDRPIITGRVYTNLQKTPYKLPDSKTQSGWKSSSSPQTGGYNEIMFEDRAGQELVRMHAEKDLHKLVKNDERVTIGHDRTKLVQNDDAFTVGRDRTKLVQNDENVTIGNNRTKKIQNDENVTIGNNRTKKIQNDESVAIGNNHTRSVQNDENVTIGNNHTRSVQSDETVTIGNNHTRSVQSDERVTIGNDHTRSVQSNEMVSIGNDHTRSVQSNEMVSIGNDHKRSVQNDEMVTIGNNHTHSVQNDEMHTVGGDRSRTVQNNEDIVVAKSRSKKVGENLRDFIGQSHSVMVGANRSTEVGLIDSTRVGNTHMVMVSPPGEGSGGDATYTLHKPGYIESSTGKAKITLDGGTLTIEAEHLVLHGSKAVTITAAQGADVTIKGGPFVKIN